MDDLKHTKHHESQGFNQTYSRHALDRGEPGGEMGTVCSDSFSSKILLSSVGTYPTDSSILEVGAATADKTEEMLRELRTVVLQFQLCRRAAAVCLAAAVAAVAAAKVLA